MAKFTFKGGYSQYYPLIGLLVQPGETYDFAEAPDAHWAAVDGAVSAPETVPVSVAQPESVSAAEALLEANPALAEKLVMEAAQNA